MDAQLDAAALALAAGDPLAALQRVSLRGDAPALALRGIALAQLGELGRAKELLNTAVRAFGPGEPLARARCVLAQVEVALAARDFGSSRKTLDGPLEKARQTLEAHGDGLNATHARCLQVRRWLLLGQMTRAQAALESLDLTGAPPRLLAVGELLQALVAVRQLRCGAARAALERAERAARRAAIPALLGEVASAQRALEAPAARSLSVEGARLLSLEQVEALLASPAFIVDACRRAVRGAGTGVALRRRPVLFALARTLAEAWPNEARRERLMATAFGARFSNASQRARLRVEMSRLRRALRSLANVEATPGGFRLRPRTAPVVVLAPPLDHEHAGVLALLGDGESWSSSGLALAFGASQRTVQRALLALQREGKAHGIGSGRARRWVAAPAPGFTTALLLPPAADLE